MAALRSSTFAAFIMLACAAMAHAECSWVLWLKTGGNATEPSGWYSADGFDSRKPCVERITQIKQQFDASRLSSGYSLGSRSETSETRVSYRLTANSSWDHAQCLPGTVDPRGAASR